MLVTTQLVHAASDRHLWAKSYERDLKDVLSLQREIARTVVTEVRVALSPDEAARLAKANPVDPEVPELYWRGRFHLNKGVEDELEKAHPYFDQALRKPRRTRQPMPASPLGPALSELYRAPVRCCRRPRLRRSGHWNWTKALREAHASLGTIHFLWDRDWASAERG